MSSDVMPGINPISDEDKLELETKPPDFQI